MALLWQSRQAGNHYEVRSAGRTRRLYTNGICHSDYNPGHAVTKSIWDCLFLPALFKDPTEVRRVLILGVGGGSVVHMLQRYVQPVSITGVELSSVHLEVAERYFGLGGLDLYEADACSWLAAYDGPPFDVIVDDLFLEEGSEARRAIGMDAEWLRLLLRHLAPRGVLSVNFPDARELKACAWFSHATCRRRLPAAFTLRTAYLDNVVGAFCRFDTTVSALRRQVVSIPALARSQKNGQLRYSIRRLRHP